MSNTALERKPLIGAIEAGGTKVVCALGRSWLEIRAAEKFVVPTTSPDVTTSSVMNWFEAQSSNIPLAAIGIATFGPIDFSTGIVTSTTPKTAWRGLNWSEVVTQRLPRTAVGIDTDTNAAGFAEWRWGAARHRRVAAYVTVGTGVGGALIVDGKPLHGLMHPEFGHMLIPRRRGDLFVGTCPTHGDCLEGLASGVAVEGRWNSSGSQLAPDHGAWDLESDYLALALVNLIMIASPEIIVLGGGVMTKDGLLESVRRKTCELAAGYIDKIELTSGGGTYIVAPTLGPAAGVVGAFALGARAAAAAQ